jgi:purine-binding chemotaxis protein CheW
VKTTRYCTFVLDKLHLGVEAERVQEIIQQQEITRVPLASPIVRGLINLRGHIVTAIDLRRRLGLPDTADSALTNVVVRTSFGDVSLLVDRAGEVLEPDETTFEPPPETVRGPVREVIRGGYKMENGLLLVLDSDKAVTDVGDR